jgi:hypothetical protein
MLTATIRAIVALRRPWGPRGVPTPMSVRIQESGIEAADVAKSRFKMFA